MKHIIFNSGGIGSWASLIRVIESHGKDDVICLFTDTLIEDRDLYRFLIESIADAYEIDRPTELLSKCDLIPDIVSDYDVDIRKELLPKIASDAMDLLPNLVWIADGRTPWDVFFDVRFLGNSRLAQCSHKLKQGVADKYIRANYSPDDCTLYLGIDWTEEHRTKAPAVNWAPYSVKFPMCDEPYADKADMLADLVVRGIQQPRLYAKNFAHNNCGGFCVRAGQGHFANLLKEFPEQFRYHEEKERAIREYLGKDVTILKKVRKGVTHRLSLEELRQSIDQDGGNDVDYADVGGCGCFVNYDDKITEVSE